MNIPIDEQIARQRAVIRHCEGKSGINIDGDKAILATLERVKATEAGLPVEPEFFRNRRVASVLEESRLFNYIDTLRAYAVQKEAALQVAQQDSVDSDRIIEQQKGVIAYHEERAEKAEIELKIEREYSERLRKDCDEHAKWRAALADKLHDTEAENAALKLDAERYRWLKEQQRMAYGDTAVINWNIGHDWQRINSESLDAAIDQARAK